MFIDSYTVSATNKKINTTYVKITSKGSSFDDLTVTAKWFVSAQFSTVPPYTVDSYHTLTYDFSK